MNKLLLQYLKENFTQADEAANHLSISLERCKNFISSDDFSEDQLIELEALTGRFARLSDILIQKIFKTIDRLDASIPGTVRDRLINAEKKGLITDTKIFIEIRDTRNSIAHEYESNALKDIFEFAFKHSVFLTDALNSSKEYSQKFYID